MKRLPRLGPVVAAALLGTLLVAALVAGPASAQEGGGQPSAGEVAISVSKSEVSALTGDRFTFTTEITNSGSEATPPLIANLNFVSLDESTYIDPEDWSPRRTVNIAPVGPASSVRQSWTVNPILKGDVAVYVVVLPDSPGVAGAGPLVASPAVHVRVGEQRSLNPGGVLPVVLAVPGVLALAFAGLRVGRARARGA
ncbi:MAG TPA: hypothetical protein VJN32_02280 [Dehalococcoidia bacterium]|nr:hypothetical protein [Dehalococcoidia bacterium]